MTKFVVLLVDNMSVTPETYQYGHRNTHATMPVTTIGLVASRTHALSLYKLNQVLSRKASAFVARGWPDVVFTLQAPQSSHQKGHPGKPMLRGARLRNHRWRLRARRAARLPRRAPDGVRPRFASRSRPKPGTRQNRRPPWGRALLWRSVHQQTTWVWLGHRGIFGRER